MGGIAMIAPAKSLDAMAGDLGRARNRGAFGVRERGVAERVVADVRRRGDTAVLQVVREFDNARARRSDLVADAATLRRAGRSAPRDMRLALDLAYQRIRAFHELEAPRQPARRDDTGVVRLTASPLRRVGALIPRGATAYPSTALMTGIPAQIARVGQLVAVSPMGQSGTIDASLAYALTLVEAAALYRAGGAAAVAALAYGTKSMTAVDKIVGPGNAYAAAAKWLVSADVGIDALQGPSELVVVASGDADAATTALDLLAQTEHGSGAFAALISDSATLLRDVGGALAAHRVSQALARRVFRYRASSLRAAVFAANEAAPEHVLLAGRAAAALSAAVDRAGAVFVGSRSAVAFGDYLAGTNHCLPTGGTARWSSALRVEDFVRWTSRVQMRGPASALVAAGATVARHEGMRYHAESMEARRS